MKYYPTLISIIEVLLVVVPVLLTVAYITVAETKTMPLRGLKPINSSFGGSLSFGIVGSTSLLGLNTIYLCCYMVFLAAVFPPLVYITAAGAGDISTVLIENSSEVNAIVSTSIDPGSLPLVR